MSSTSSRPNIVFIFADQHRHDALGCAGHPSVRTPNLDWLSATGLRFSNAWCQSPVCQPSRASLITGRYPHEVGVLRNFGPDMDGDWPTFMRRLQAAGYVTANIGKTHYYAEGLVQPDGPRDMRENTQRVKQFGFNHVVEEFDRYVHAMDGVLTPYTEYLRNEGVFDAYRDSIRSVWRLTEHHWDGVTSPLTKAQDLTSFLTREASAWLAEQTADRPFFLQLSYVAPHVPLMGDPEWSSFYSATPVSRGPQDDQPPPVAVWSDYLRWCARHANAHLLSDDYVQRGARQYFAMISLIDECIGQLFQQLAAQGLLDNTWIIYSSDHGEMLGDHGLMAKFNFYRGSVQVPLILRPAGGCAGQETRAMAALVDLAPTLLEIGQAEPLEGARGGSLLAVLRGSGNGHDHLFSEIQSHGRGANAPVFRAIRDTRYRFTMETGSGTACELFDLEEDPGELHNLVTDPRQQTRISAMRETLHQMMTTG